LSEQTFHEFAERYTGSRAGSAAIGMRVRFRHADTIFEDERTTEQTADRQQGHGEQLQQQPIHCPFALTCSCQIWWASRAVLPFDARAPESDRQ